MVDSGIKIEANCQARINEIIKGCDGKHKAGFMIMRIKKADGDSVERVHLEKSLTVGECDEYCCGQELKNGETPIWYAYRKHLAEYDLAFGVSYCHYTTADGRPNATKLVFTLWNNNDKAPMKDKMKYSSTKVYNKMGSNVANVPASDEDDISYTNVKDKVQRK